MYRSISWPVCALLVAVLFVTGCQTMSSRPQPLSTEEARLRKENQDFNRTVAEGAAVGALLGAVVGGLTSKGWEGAAIGAGAGAIAGGTAGAYVAKKQRIYANEEARIDAMIADVRQDNENLREYIATAEQVIATDMQRLQHLNAQLAEGEISRREAEQRVARVRENGEVIQGAIVSLREGKTEYEYAREETRRQNPYADVALLDREISMLESNIQFLEQDLDSLNEALEVSPVG